MLPHALLAPLFALLLPLAAPAQAPPAELRRPAAGFAIALPMPDWTVMESGEIGAAYQLVLTPPDAPGRAAITVRVGPNGPPETPAAYRDALRATLAGQPQHAGIEACSRRLAGRDAPGLALDTESGGVRYRVRQFVLVEHGLRYTVQAHAPLADFAGLEDAFARAFDAFGFLPLDGAAAEAAELRRLAARCGSEWEWAPDWPEAARRARAEHKLVFVYARFYPGFEMSDATISGPFMDEDVVAFVREHFVPLRLTAAMDAPFRDPSRYGLGPSTFGQAVLVADAGGRILAEDALLEVETLDAALRRALAASGLEAAAAPPAQSAAAAALAGSDLLTRAEALIDLGRIPEAEAALNDLLAQDPDASAAPQARFLLGACACGRADRAAAERWWRELARDCPDSRWAWQAAAQLTGTFFEAGLGADLARPEPSVLAAAGWRAPAPWPAARAAAAERDALAWLLAAQQPDGSWIGPSALSRLRPREADAFTVATTAIAGRVLLRCDEPAARRALDFLLAARAREQAAPPRVFYMDYTPWSKALSLRFLADCLAAGLGEPPVLRAAMAELVLELAGQQKPGGGWSYYLSGSLEGAARPAPQSMSFTTAAVVIALEQARRAGVAVPDAVLHAGLECLEGMRNANGSFEYMTSPGPPDGARTTALAGAAGRGPVCALALLRGGREDRDELRRRLDLLLEHLDELAREQGKSLMHAGADAQGSHYLMFDYATAAEAVAELPPAQRRRFRQPLLAAILAARNADGSFTDNPILGPAAATTLALAAFASLRPLP